VSRNALLALCAVLTGLIAITLPELGSDPWPFRPPSVEPQGVLAPLVRAAGEEWDVGIARAAAFLAALAVGAVALVALRWRRPFPAWSGIALALGVALMLLLPSALLQLGLRQSTQPWFHTNDSTFQIDIAGDLVLDGENPYGHDYRADGLDRFYTRDGSISESVRRKEVALDHFAYFPGAAVTAAGWRVLPEPFDDYRFFVLLCTLGLFGAAMLVRAPLSWRLVIGVLLVANPIAVRSAWFGQNDAPSILGVVLAFALVTRGHFRSAAAALAAAVLLKQFAVVAIPFLALMIPRERWLSAGAWFAGIVAVCSLPFLIADPGAFVDDTVKYGAGTYKIVGYGLSAILIRVGILEDRDGSYPFVLFALLLWLPVTVWLLVQQRRAEELWFGVAAFSISILVLLFIGRTFNNYYLVWPATGAAIAALIALSARTGTSGPSGTPASSRPPPGSRTSPG
jgi:Glycosyltransferase family 87